MNHDQALALEAPERYLLNELEDADVAAFEEHYFDCIVCAAEVKAAYAMSDALHATKKNAEVVTFKRASRGWPRFVTPLAAAASAAIAFFGAQIAQVNPLQLQNAAQQVRIATLSAPVQIDETTLSDTRGEGDALHADHGLMLHVEIPAGASTSYTIRLLDASGATARPDMKVDAAALKGLYPYYVPPATLKPGKYTLRVDGTEPGIASHEVTIR